MTSLLTGFEIPSHKLSVICMVARKLNVNLLFTLHLHFEAKDLYDGIETHLITLERRDCQMTRALLWFSVGTCVNMRSLETRGESAVSARQLDLDNPRECNI